MTLPDLAQAIHWHQDLIRTLRDRQFQAAVAAIVGVLVYQFTGIHISPTAIQLWVSAAIAYLLGSSIAEHGHARAIAALAAALGGPPLPSARPSAPGESPTPPPPADNGPADPGASKPGQ